MLELVNYAYYDRDADVAWFPTGESDDVVSERAPGGLRDYDRTSHKLVAIDRQRRPAERSWKEKTANPDLRPKLPGKNRTIQ